MNTDPLAAIRRSLALAVGENAVFDGWTAAAVASAAAGSEVDRAVAGLAFGKDPATMIVAYVEAVDAALETAFLPQTISAMRVSQRVRAILIKRFELMKPAREAVRTSFAIMTRPRNAVAAARLGWAGADAMWRLAGDTSTDFNHYSKRAILASITAATLLVWIDDDSDDAVATIAFIDRRLGDVARFEKTKAQWLGSADRRPSLARFVGRLRYPPT